MESRPLYTKAPSIILYLRDFVSPLNKLNGIPVMILNKTQETDHKLSNDVCMPHLPPINKLNFSHKRGGLRQMRPKRIIINEAFYF